MSIENTESEKIAEISIDLEESRNNVMQYRVRSTGEKETEFELPRYDIFLGWIEIFGIPPFNEWVVLDRFDKLEKNFSGMVNGRKYSESITVEDHGVTGTVIELERESGDAWERHHVREMDYVKASTSGGVALFEVDHSRGEYSARLVRTIAQESQDIEELREKLGERERKYLDRVTEENGEPSIVVLKEATVDGTTPPVYRRFFPFWEKKEFDESEVRSLEIGYMDRGDNETGIDELHGGWYKLFSLEDFDHSHLEIREGNWKSTDVEFEGEEQTTKQHYEKHLYIPD